MPRRFSRLILNTHIVTTPASSIPALPYPSSLRKILYPQRFERSAVLHDGDRRAGGGKLAGERGGDVGVGGARAVAGGGREAADAQRERAGGGDVVAGGVGGVLVGDGGADHLVAVGAVDGDGARAGGAGLGEGDSAVALVQDAPAVVVLAGDVHSRRGAAVGDAELRAGQVVEGVKDDRAQQGGREGVGGHGEDRGGGLVLHNNRVDARGQVVAGLPGDGGRGDEGGVLRGFIPGPQLRGTGATRRRFS